MLSIDRDVDSELVRVWQLVHELSDQLAHNQKMTAALQSQANSLKEQVSHNQSGYALRRFNVDISRETFESEIERLNAQLIIENQTLLHENKQLSMLLKEYEQTLDTVMTKFRNHALAAQQHELTLTRHYETLLMSRESTAMQADMNANLHVTNSAQRLATSLRLLLRSIAGEDMENVDQEEYPNLDEETIEALTSSANGSEDWALQRECEIARLEKENSDLRRLLGIDPETAKKHGIHDDDPYFDERRLNVLLSKEAGGRSGRIDSLSVLDSPQQQAFSLPPEAPGGDGASGEGNNANNNANVGPNPGPNPNPNPPPSAGGVRAFPGIKPNQAMRRFAVLTNDRRFNNGRFKRAGNEMYPAEGAQASSSSHDLPQYMWDAAGQEYLKAKGLLSS